VVCQTRQQHVCKVRLTLYSPKVTLLLMSNCMLSGEGWYRYLLARSLIRVWIWDPMVETIPLDDRSSLCRQDANQPITWWQISSNIGKIGISHAAISLALKALAILEVRWPYRLPLKYKSAQCEGCVVSSSHSKQRGFCQGRDSDRHWKRAYRLQAVQATMNQK